MHPITQTTIDKIHWLIKNLPIADGKDSSIDNNINIVHQNNESIKFEYRNESKSLSIIFSLQSFHIDYSGYDSFIEYENDIDAFERNIKSLVDKLYIKFRLKEVLILPSKTVHEEITSCLFWHDDKGLSDESKQLLLNWYTTHSDDDFVCEDNLKISVALIQIGSAIDELGFN